VRARFVQGREPDHGAYLIDDEVEEADLDVQAPSMCTRAFGALRAVFVLLALVLPLLLSGYAVDAGAHINQHSIPVAGALGMLLLTYYGVAATSVPIFPEHSCGHQQASQAMADVFIFEGKKVRSACIHPESFNFNNPCISHKVREGLEWCSDSGTNRFVTNDMADFVPGSVVSTSTTVSVGSGNTSAPCYGDVMVQSTLNGSTVLCKNVLYLPDCPKKLMPCSPFVKKGCSYTLENDKVYLRDPEKNVILEGHDVGGLYYYHSRTVRVADSETTPKSGAPALGVPINHGVYFGLPSTGTVSAGATDFARRLLETHWAFFGHLQFSTN